MKKKIQHENSIWFEFDLQPRNSFLEIFIYSQPICTTHTPIPPTVTPPNLMSYYKFWIYWVGFKYIYNMQLVVIL